MLLLSARSLLRWPSATAAGDGLTHSLARLTGPAHGPLVQRFNRLTTQYTTPEQTTLSRQNDLKTYPVPQLSDTLPTYVQSVKPFLNEAELNTTVEKVRQFGQSGGEGQKLQALLEKHAQGKDNWLADWWLDNAYLKSRDTVVVWCSPGLALPKQTFKDENAQFDYAARIISGLIDFKLMLDKQCLPVEMMGKDPMDMEQYYLLFGSTRMPGKNKDLLVQHPNSKHIIVMHNNNIFKMYIYGEDGDALSDDQLCGCLRYIAQESRRIGPGKPVGLLTSDQRDNWHEAFTLLQPGNEDTFRQIETSLFALSLDNSTDDVSAQDEMSRSAGQALHGFGADKCSGNRWFDKTLNVFVGASGQNGIVHEHSSAEGVPLMKMADHALHCANGGNRLGEVKPARRIKPPRFLSFEGVDRVEAQIQTAQNNLNNLVQDMDLRPLHFRGFGKSFVKAQRVSPDSFVQMAFQLAFYRLHGTPGACYESGGLRTYSRGRTDTIRSCSVEAVHFAKTMLDNSADVEEKHKAMVEALVGHSKYAKMTVNAGGVDRHLLGLKLIAMENGASLPELYEDAAFKRSTHLRLSTSQVSGKYDSFLNFGPLVHDGYGCCYNIRDYDFLISVSAFHSCPETSAKKFHEELNNSLNDMHDVFVAHNHNQKGAKL